MLAGAGRARKRHHPHPRIGENRGADFGGGTVDDVAGEWTRSLRNDTTESYNPATGTPVSEREAVFFRAADVLAAKANDITEVLIAESGSIAGKAGFEVGYCFDLLRTAAFGVPLIISNGVATSISCRGERSGAPTLYIQLNTTLPSFQKTGNRAACS
jgi:hypothetical protein